MLDGRISLITPEGVRLLLTPAGPVPRALAKIIDLLVYIAVIVLFVNTVPYSRTANGLLLLLAFLLFWGYPVLTEVYFGGRTLGKLLLGLKTVRADGLPVGWREAMLRNILIVADFLPVMYATGIVCMIADPQFRRLGDIVANTLVIYHEKPALRPLLSKQAPVMPAFPLSPPEQRTLIDLIEREASIPYERMLELANLAEPITGTTGDASLQRLRGIVASFHSS